jgi:hypothetical protein
MVQIGQSRTTAMLQTTTNCIAYTGIQGKFTHFFLIILTRTFYYTLLYAFDENLVHLT